MGLRPPKWQSRPCGEARQAAADCQSANCRVGAGPAAVANRRAGCQPNAARFSHDRIPAKIVGRKSTRETTRKQGFASSGRSARRCLPKLRDKKRVALGCQPAPHQWHTPACSTVQRTAPAAAPRDWIARVMPGWLVLSPACKTRGTAAPVWLAAGIRRFT